MTGFNILMANDSAFRFVGMMCRNSGLVEKLPKNVRTNIRNITKAVVVFNNNIFNCMFEAGNDLFDAMWHGDLQGFEGKVYPYKELDDSQTIGLITDKELDMLFELFVNGKPIVVGNSRIERTAVPPYEIHCINGTFETIFAKNAFMAGNGNKLNAK